MADGTTPRGYKLPEVGGSVDTWGGKLNDNWGAVDGDVTDNETAASDAQTDATQALADAAAAQATADAALPVLGGTMEGLVEVFTAESLFVGLDGSGAQVLDFDAANVFVCIAEGNVQFTISGTVPTDFNMICLLLKQQLGIYTADWSGVAIEWAYGVEPTWSENGYDWISLISTDGVNWSGALAQPDVQ